MYKDFGEFFGPNLSSSALKMFKSSEYLIWACPTHLLVGVCTNQLRSGPGFRQSLCSSKSKKSI